MLLGSRRAPSPNRGELKVKKLLTALLTTAALTTAASAASLKDEAQKLESDYVAAFNHKGNPAQFFTADATVVAQDGHATTGRSNIAQTYSHIIGHFTIASTLSEVHALGDGGWSLAAGVQTFADGHNVKAHAIHVYERENGVLKYRVLSIGVDVPLPQKTACQNANC
jgi:ketosteroid isomerase-like protein